MSNLRHPLCGFDNLKGLTVQLKLIESIVFEKSLTENFKNLMYNSSELITLYHEYFLSEIIS